MAQCPKCGKRLRLYHWRPECPACGVNMIYYKSNDRLLAETEQAEIEHALHQPRIDRAKAAFFGSPPAIARIVLSVLPLGALFLPLALRRSVEGSDLWIAVNAVDIYKYVDKAGVGGMQTGILEGNPADLSILLLLLSAVLVLLGLICLPLSLGPHGRARNALLDVGMLVSAGGAAGCWVLNHERLAAGAYVYFGLLFVLLVYNLILGFAGLKLKRTVCYIGGLPSDEYFAMVDAGVPELEIRKKMVEALTGMQEEALRQAKAAEEKAQAERAARK